MNSQNNEDKGIVNRDKVWFIHSPNGKSIMTVASRVSENQTQVTVALAFADKRHFKRSEGRKVAFGRLEKGKGAFVTVMPFNGHSSDSVAKFFNEVQDVCNDFRTELQEIKEELAALPENDIRVAGTTEEYIELMTEYNAVPSAWRKLRMRNDENSGLQIDNW